MMASQHVGSKDSPTVADVVIAVADLLSSLRSEDYSSSSFVPVIDVGGLENGNPEVRRNIVNKIGKASRVWGFFQTVNHNVPELVKRVHEQAHDFFNLPMDVKKRVVISGPNPRFLGYKETFTSNEKYKAVHLKENLGGFCSPSAPMELEELANKIWPAGNPKFCDTLEEHCRAMQALGLSLLEVLAESLGLQREFYSQHFKKGGDSISIWRLHHFPTNPAPPTVWRTDPHSDPSVLTILSQDVGGLQVRKHDGDMWVDVHPLLGSLVINVGDILEAWSNGRFPSGSHRVKLHEHIERFSTVYFLDVGPQMSIESPTKLIDEHHPSVYKPFIVQDFRANFERLKHLGDIRKGKSLDYLRRSQ